MAQTDVVLILVAVLWLTVVTVIVGACQGAARGDGVQREIE
jgi:hypothetical protein